MARPGRLTMADVTAIREARRKGEKLVLVAMRFGISQPYASLIAREKRPIVKPLPLFDSPPVE